MNRQITVGVIAERLGVPIHRVAYLVRSRNLQPTARAGRLRVFDDAAVELIRRELSHDGRQPRDA
jgi:DNA-binding transcriptional MerR regulator